MSDPVDKFIRNVMLYANVTKRRRRVQMVTIKDIAKQLDLSASTISRALNDHPAISEETKKLVLECVKQNSYVPNRNARNLVNRQNHTIGFMIPEISDVFFAQSAHGVEEVLYRSGHEIVYSSTERNPARVLDFLTRAQEYRYSGVFLTPDKWDDNLIETVHKLGIPVVSLRRKTPRTTPEIPYVDSNHYEGCYEATEYLISQGHTEIGLISSETLINTERLSGYEQAMRKNNLHTNVMCDPMTKHASKRYTVGYNAAKSLLEQNPDVTAVLATDDRFAIGAMEYFYEIGLKIPEDISIIGCDDRLEGRLFPILLSTVQQDLNELGRQAAEMMLRMVNSHTLQSSSISLKSRLILRRTTGPKRAR